eukprot:TRINITY_DN47674_c0_g1_i1.p1 TRINITY_DN47674_c0_g1~~TRINITY_DN47674_c0_g1_i1.p1  ORF type:complete len:185 (+),score=30.56 TRINITY_DN47674_c0_g1_i1:58-612(+)
MCIRDSAWRDVKADWIAKVGTKIISHEQVWEQDWSTAIGLWGAIQDVLAQLEREGVPLDAKDRSALRTAVRDLDVPQDYAELVDKKLQEYEGNHSLFNLSVDIQPMKSLDIPGFTIERFQLRKMGHLLPRSVPTASDARVNFNPDMWPVSYTHLTLPTKRIVSISVVAASLQKKQLARIGELTQ